VDLVPSGEKPAGYPASDGEPVCFMLTTSGSTGLPKIVPLTVGAVDRFTAWAHERFGLGTGRTVLNFAPLNFDLCLLDVWATLRYGGRVVLVDAPSAGRAGVLRRLLADTRPHVIQAVPLLFELLTSLEERDPLPGTQHVISTGEAIRAACLAELPSLFPHARLYNLYGCTETNDSFLHEFPAPGAATGEIPLGEPLPGVRARLVDEHGEVVEGPGVGELVVHTPFQTPGYLARDEAGAAAKFAAYDGIPHFRSGDLVERRPDGTLVLLGRNDFQVKVRGQRVNTEEVERVLRAHPDVLQAAVVAVPDPFGGRRLHGLVRHRAGEAPSTLALRRHCAEHLLPAAVPASLRLTDEPLPATGTGKIDRARIRRAEMGEHRE
jgi:acyl-coenzyme A synthetase/AMP-(fatty) acid ligase